MMPIQILSPQLANQIAAGEVVERPSSVVKELLENSIDAGATQIDIDIEKGGSKRIRIRDNGHGIGKDELQLALSRHATSKVSCLQDLEAICSLGFRGEALASISSVSRLTLTSRTAAQNEAWQAEAQGRDMQVAIRPAAHPIGTTIDVVDLFFNTPARRRFLRADKTEFTHIEDVIKRIVLSRFDVQIKLTHNGKLQKQFRVGDDDVSQRRRIAAVCGQHFVDNVLELQADYDLVKIKGWLGEPHIARQQRDIQYCYVNGRMMKDKLINHAIRQAYESRITSEQYAAYVLFIEVDPAQVDVNVHPAKHEVRFHQARLIHDFIYQALHSALNQKMVEIEASSASLAYDPETGECISKQTIEQNYPDVLYAGQQTESLFSQQINTNIKESPAAGSPYNGNRSTVSAANVYAKQQTHYSDLMSAEKTIEHVASAPTQQIEAETSTKESPLRLEQQGLLCQLNETTLLVKSVKQLYLINIQQFEHAYITAKLGFHLHNEDAKAQPLLLPVAIKMDDVLSAQYTLAKVLISSLNIFINQPRKDTLVIQKVPAMLRETNLAYIIPQFLLSVTPESVKNTEQALKKLARLMQNSNKLINWQALQAMVKEFPQFSGDSFCYYVAEHGTLLPYENLIPEQKS